MGDRPLWMKIKGYREEKNPRTRLRKGELMLSLRGRDYWFPVTPKVYERFVSTVLRDSRYKGLRYLQEYIRRYRGYKNVWPSKRYVKLNQISKHSFQAS